VLIDQFIPTGDRVSRHQIEVRAPAEATYAAIRQVNLGRSRAIRLLLLVRGLVRPGAARSVTLDDALRRGFVVLGESPGEELVLGLIGRFWTPSGGVRRVAPWEFVPFAEPGYAKAAVNLRVEPRGPDACLAETETRVATTDESARRRFARYWRIVGPGSGFIRRRMLALARADAERTGLP